MTSIANWSGKSEITHLQAERIIQQIVMRREMLARRRIGRRGYGGAVASRLTSDWTTSSMSEDAQARTSLKAMRERARQQARDNDYAKMFLRLVETNIVGQGINLQMDVVEPRKGKDGAIKNVSDTAANDLIEEAWKEFSKPENFTVTRTMSRQDVERLLSKSCARDGEYIVRRVRGFNNKFRYALQIFEPDQLDHELNSRLPNGNTIRMGVEFNEWREPVAYWMLKNHPGDEFYFQSGGARHERIPANEIIHGFLREYPTQSRGITWFHTPLRRIHMLDGYEEAVIVHARAAASKMGFFVRKTDPNAQYQADDEDADGNLISEAEPGAFEQLPYGMEFQQWDPKEPNAEFNSFRKGILRAISAGLGVSYNALANDLESVNYSSLRAGTLQERDVWMLLQSWFITSFEMPVFGDFLEMSLLTRQVALPEDKFDKFNRPKFIPRRWPWVDPLKDILAAKEAVALRIRTHGDIIAEAGGDFEETMRRFGREKEIAAEHGVTLEYPAPSATPLEDPDKTEAE
ncbi:MAG: phage portal protein [Verrucomicrobiota bacterium]